MSDFFSRIVHPEGASKKTEATRIPPVFSSEPEPLAPDVSASAATSAADVEPPVPQGPFALFAPDVPTGPDALGAEVVLAPVAELLAHRRTTPPLTVGLLGGPGTGKSFALEHIIARVKRIAAAAANLGGGSPFLSRIVTVRIEAAQSNADPATAIAAEIFRTLTAAGANAESYAALAQEAAHAVRDPRVAAREANERLTDARNRLHAEREILHDLDGRRAKLVETVLYEAAGSHVDTYARMNRSRIEARLRAFGLSHGDALGTYRDLVRDVAETGIATGRVAAFAKALWAYRGQTRLLVGAVILVLLAWGSVHAAAGQNVWLPWLRSTGEFGTAVANVLAAHTGWFNTLSGTAILAACLAVVACIWRAWRFQQPIFRGASLLQFDLEARRRDLDGLIAHQTRRVDATAAEVDAHAQRAQDAERRADAADQGATRLVAPLVDSPFETAGGAEQARLARAFVLALDAAMARGPANTFNVPQRILVAIDDLDSLAPARSASFIDAAHHLLSGQNLVVVLAMDPNRLADVSGETRRADWLARYVQIPLYPASFRRDSCGGLIRGLVESAPRENAPGSELDASRSQLDLPWLSGETDLLAALAPLVGHSPRTAKRFVNIYRVARARSETYPALALLLALEAGGTDAERHAVEAALAAGDSSTPLHLMEETRLTDALEACRAANGDPLTVGDFRAAKAIAAAYQG